MKPEVIIKNLSKNFGRVKVIDNISFEVYEKEFISVIGKSGCGKTTLLYLVQGFLKPTTGEINVFGKKGFVFQDHNIFPWKTVRQNIEIAPINNGLDKEDIKKISDELIKELNLLSFENYYPNQISEGMKQRVGIARCLANNPEILLMDEPFGSLDYLTKLKIQDFLKELWKKHNLTILFVTHDIDEAIRLSDRIIVLSDSPARIKEIIDVDEYENKANLKEVILKLLEGEENTN